MKNVLVYCVIGLLTFAVVPGTLFGVTKYREIQQNNVEAQRQQRALQADFLYKKVMLRAQANGEVNLVTRFDVGECVLSRVAAAPAAPGTVTFDRWTEDTARYACDGEKAWDASDTPMRERFIRRIRIAAR